MQTFVFLRHAEKPANDNGQLSQVGFARALKLPPVLLAKFGKPDQIIAPETTLKPAHTGGVFSYVRPLMTIEPLAVSLGMEVKTTLSWDESEMMEITLCGENGLTFVCWEHHVLHTIVLDLVKKFNGNFNDVPEWDSHDFDSLWIVKIENGKATFSVDKENLN